MYLIFACTMFFIGGAMAMVIRLELFKPGHAVRGSAAVQLHDHDARADHDLRRGHAGVDGACQLDDPDAGGGARTWRCRG